VRSCSCSFCSIHGAIYTSDPTGELTVTVKSKTDLNIDQFSSKQVDFIFCASCGVLPLATTVIDSKVYAIINLKTAQIDLSQITIHNSDFSDESAEKSTHRRKSNWIANVKII